MAVLIYSILSLQQGVVVASDQSAAGILVCNYNCAACNTLYILCVDVQDYGVLGDDILISHTIKSQSGVNSTVAVDCYNLLSISAILGAAGNCKYNVLNLDYAVRLLGVLDDIALRESACGNGSKRQATG